MVYQATVSTATGESYSYIGLTENEFKKRWYGHSQSFNNPEYRLRTELSKLIWELKVNNTEYKVDWKIITKAGSYTAGAKHCNLCLTEKLYILKNPDSLNKRSEILSKCRHARKFLIRVALDINYCVSFNLNMMLEANILAYTLLEHSLILNL